MKQIFRFIIVFTAFCYVICSMNEKLEASIKKCKKDNKGYDIQLQIKKWEDCVDDSVERFHDSLYHNNKSPYEMLCGNHGMHSCLQNIEQALVRCSEHKEMFGFTYNAMYGGLTYLCSEDNHQLANLNDEIKQCFQEKKLDLDACIKNDAMGLTLLMYSNEMCGKESEAAKCYVKVLNECKDKVIGNVAKMMFEHAFGETQCKNFFPISSSAKQIDTNRPVLYFSIISILYLKIHDFM